MSTDTPSMHYYRLHPGHALTAINMLLRELTKELKLLHEVDPEAEADDAFYKKFYETIAQRNPNLLEAIGYEAPATVIQDIGSGVKRAYLRYPTIAAVKLGGNTTRFYIGVPTDYSGTHFVPEGAKPLNEQETRAIETYVTNNAGSRRILFPTVPHGVALPADYVAPQVTEQQTHYQHFVAAGRTAAILNDLAERRNTFLQAIQSLTNSIKIIVAGYIQNAQVSLRAETNFAYGRRPQIILDARDRNNEAIALPQSKYFHQTLTLKDKISISADTYTAEGQILKPEFDAVSITPSLRDYTELTRPKLNDVPYTVRDIGDMQVLSYTSTKKLTRAFCPPDATEISQRAVLWMGKDNDDRLLGVTPPPVPADIAAELDKLRPISNYVRDRYETVNNVPA